MPKDQAYYEAEKKIAEALKTGAAKLDLRSMKLTELPESIRQLKDLQKLDLGRDYPKKEEENNRLTSLPDSLGQLTKLTSLELSSNQLTALPNSLLAQLTQLTSLDLSNNQLMTLPDSLGGLTQLANLYLSRNQLTALPESLGQLINLTELNISYNLLANLPVEFWRLQNLKELLIGYNNFTYVPAEIWKLTKLKRLGIGGAKIKNIPDELWKLSQLEELDIYGNTIVTKELWNFTQLKALGFHVGQLGDLSSEIGQLNGLTTLRIYSSDLTNIPMEIGQLTQLQALRIPNNKISNLPSSLAQLKHLKTLDLTNNPLNPALQSAYDACSEGKYEPLFAYLRSLEQNAEPLYEAKLVLVGEGNVGKTTLLKALKGDKEQGPRQGETTTHGVEIDIHGLRVPHPEKEGVEIQLNAWDFGGQDVYRVTHQFFFSRRSLYLLVWEPRRGVQQGQVEDWLNMIRLRVGDSARVIIVSTHCKTGERIARIDKDVLKRQYGDMIVGFHEVDSLVPDPATGEMVGIAKLKKVIASEAAKLKQMGMGFNRDWKAARDELLQRSEPRIAYSAFCEVCENHGLSEIDTSTLARLMHDLGYIVHYDEDEKLRDDVVLKPEWLTKAIGFVLENRATAEREGILPDGELYKVWHDHAFPNEPRYDPSLYPFFLRLMEKYDVCYRLPEERHASLVAQHVPQVRPTLPWLPEQEPPANLRRIAMVCAMEEDPPGLVPWMIVRTHDYAVEQNHHRLHWQKGIFLHHGAHGTAMLEKRDREFHVYAQAQWPEYFMNVLQHTLQKLITDNWPGLEGRYRFMVPCPELIEGQPCKGRFNIHALRQFIAEGDVTVRCQECSCRLSIAELLFGFEERDMSVQLREIKEQLAGMDSRIANYFMATLRAIADEGKNGPRLFTFRSRDAGLSPKQLFARPLEIQLWCEAEGCQHPVMESGKGVYPIDVQHEWVKQVAPYANFALKVLATVAPIAAPAINTCFGPKTTEAWKIADQLSLASAIIGKLPAKIETSDRGMPPGKLLGEQERSGLLALHRFLNEVDPTQAKLGLHRVPTYTGDFRWLCQYHYEAWQPNIPDVIS